MPLSDTQKTEILQVLDTIYSHTVGRRVLATIFRTLPDQEAWKDYYDVIPNPRALDTVKANVEKNKTTVETTRKDIELVFRNAMQFNQESSTIWEDAKILLDVFEKAWVSKPSINLKSPKLTLRHTRRTTSPAEPKRSSPLPAVKTEPGRDTPLTSTRSRSSKGKSATPAARRPPTPEDEEMDVDVDPEEEADGDAEDYKDDGFAGEDGEVEAEVEIEAETLEAKQELSASATPFAAEQDLSESEHAGPSPKDEPVDLPAERIIQHTESLMKIWDGPGDEGWMPLPRGDPHSRYIEILGFLKTFRVAATGDRPAVALENIPDATDIPYLYHHEPISFAFIEDKAQARFYGSSQMFDIDLYRLFEKGRHIYRETNRADFGRIILLQRMWQHLTSPALASINAMSRAAWNFSSISVGPGATEVSAERAKLLESVSAASARSNAANNKDRETVEVITYKGNDYQIGDYVHLANPDDASKPIVGQVYRAFVPFGKPGHFRLTICWYYLPEHTIHNRSRVFYEKEVLKTSIYVDHPIEDVIEKIGVQFFAKHVRGRPLPPLWYPGWPIYVCDQRYNHHERSFVRIKNWISCVPEEVRTPGWMPIQPFGGGSDEDSSRTAHPRKVKSPFLKGVRGPGRIGQEGVEAPVPAAGSSGTPVPSTPTLAPGADSSNSGRRPYTKRGTGAIAQRKAKEAADAAAAAAAVQATYIPPPIQTKAAPPPPPPRPQVTVQRKRKLEDRTAVAASGGQPYLSGAKMETLPADTVEKFDRDPKTGKLLWFSGPPINITPPSAYTPRHSLTYLAYLANKEKTAEEDEDDGKNLKKVRIDEASTSVSSPSEPSLLQLLDQWKMNPDGSFVQIDPSPSRTPTTEASLSNDLLAQSLTRFANGLL